MAQQANISTVSSRNIMIALSGEPIAFTKDNLLVNQNFSHTSYNYSVVFTTGALVLIVNIVILLWMKVKERVLVDKMVTIDCIGNILMVGLLLIAYPIRIWNNSVLCGIFSCFRVYTVTLNR